MFWQFETSGFVSQIDTILDKENVTLKELMDEDDILQECKAHNQKLIDFLLRPPILEDMINLIIIEPENDMNEKLRFKYANIACEILTSDVSAINDALVCNDSMLNKLYNFIDTDKQLNPLLASFFSKIMGLLFAKRTLHVFEFLKTKDFISLLLNHIETSAIMDLLLKMMTNVDNIQMRLTWLYDNKLINRLVRVFQTDADSQRHINAAQLLCDMIKISREHQSLMQDNAEPDILLDQIESTNTVNELLTNMFTCRSESALVSGLSVLQSLLEYKKHCINVNNIQHLTPPQSNIQNASEFDGMPHVLGMQMMGGNNDCLTSDQMTPLDIERLAKGVRQVQAAILPRLNDFHSLLLNPPVQSTIRTTVGEIKPLGATRLEVAHLITALLSSNNTEAIEKLAELKALSVLIDLFFEYPWNNFLHAQVVHSIICILNNIKANNSNSTQETSDLSNSKLLLLINELLNQCHLITRILETYETNLDSAKPRPGYMGHLINIANAIADKLDESILKEQLPSEVFEKWNTFVNDTLLNINKKISTPLVNEAPHSINIDDDPYRQQDNALQQAFIEYQMQQMTRNLGTQIGFTAQEFTDISENIPNQIDPLSKISFSFETQWQEKDKRTLEFDRICSERAKTNLGSNSSDEEDLWEDRDITESSLTQQKKPLSLFGTMENTSTEFINDSFGIDSASSGGIRMEIDNGDPWSAPNASISTVPETMDTSNPWDYGSKTRTDGDAIEADSWADFSNFSSGQFASANAVHNTCITSSSVTMSSSEIHFASSETPESTTSDEAISQNMSAETGCTFVTSDSPKLNSGEQENIVSSSTADTLQNGPS